MKATIVFLLLAVLGATQVNAFWRMNCGLIQTGRVDPIISFNQASGHVHKVSGASSFNINSTADSLIASSCTSCQIQADKSAYWTPGFYFQHADGTFEEVPNQGMTIYYLGRGEDDGKKIMPFPKGLKLFSGNNNARTFDANTLTVPGGRPIAERVNFACVNYAKPAPETYGITNLDCPQGFRAQVHFQSCWDGQNLYLPDQSHVAYLSRIDNGVCPPTHPVLIPHLFYEINYDMDKIDTSKGGKYMFANGDTTGYGFHGDFMNGWDTQLLTDAIDQCMANGKLPSGVIDDCRPFAATNSFDAARRCAERSPVYPCEPVHGKIAKLPGCTGGLGSVTCSSQNQPTCPANYNVFGLSASEGNDKFSHLGCYTEASNGRALTSKTTTDATGMTVEKCLDFCAGFKYAGVQYGQECYCGNTLTGGAALTTLDKCDMACKGNQFQTCGAGRLLNLYQAKAGSSSSSSSSSVVSSTSTTSSSSVSSTSSTTTSPQSSSTSSSTSTTAPSSSSSTSSSTSTSATPSATGGPLSNFRTVGCWSEAPGRALSVTSTTSDAMTPTLCATYCLSKNQPLFGLEYGRECWCGAYLRSGSIKVSESDCSFPCPGDRSQKCGAGDRLNLWVKNDYVTPTIPRSVAVPNSGTYNYLGCFSDANPPPHPYRALSAKGMANFSAMTVELCGEFCRAYKVFGIEWGGECYCGNELANGAVQKGDRECGMTCPGNYRQLACGEGQKLSVYRRA